MKSELRQEVEFYFIQEQGKRFMYLPVHMYWMS